MKVKVRIAVAVAPDGDWNSWGSAGLSDKEKMENAVEVMAEGEARYWVEAELDVPETQVIPGNVCKET